tara:strand:+ start:92 stop:808 length:717 start_codon:yes stop_codon:yes gene_type:complete
MANGPHKACSRCGIDKELTNFSPDRRASDGLQSSCKECLNADRREKRKVNHEAIRKRERDYYLANKERIHANNKRSRERHAEKVKAGKKAWYEKAKHRPEFQARLKERQEENRDAKREYDREYRAKNRAKCLARAKKWREANPEKRAAIIHNYVARRRAQTKGGITTKELAQWKAEQKKVCYWCGVKCAKNYHVDHYEPLSKGGKHEASNLVIACGPCNLKKNAKDPLDFAQEVGRLL